MGVNVLFSLCGFFFLLIGQWQNVLFHPERMGGHGWLLQERTVYTFFQFLIVNQPRAGDGGAAAPPPKAISRRDTACRSRPNCGAVGFIEHKPRTKQTVKRARRRGGGLHSLKIRCRQALTGVATKPQTIQFPFSGKSFTFCGFLVLFGIFSFH